MGLGEAVGTCLRRYSDFTGRARRSEFWWFALAVWIVGAVTLFVWVVVAIAAIEPGVDNLHELSVDLKRVPPGSMEGVLSVLRDHVQTDLINWGLLALDCLGLFVATTVVAIPFLAAEVRRLHDAGQSGLWALFHLGGGLGVIPLILCIPEGTHGENKFGPDPTAEDGSE